MKKLLLISNSVSYGKGYLDHCEDAIVDFLGSIDSILFIPYASHDYDKYAEFLSKRLRKMDIKVGSIHNQEPIDAIKKARAIFVGGGNTFRLLKTLNDLGLIKPLHDAILHGTPYIGSSAGVNLACPTIKTTNDMPIVFPSSFDALNIISFQINPHYVDKDTKSKHKGETREERIKEFLQENDMPVLGLYENSWIKVESDSMILQGENGAKLFEKDKKPKFLKNGPLNIN